MKLIVGLGNPGREYVGTRHNIGFEVVDCLAQRLGWIGGPEEFDRLARGEFDGLALDGVVHLASAPTSGSTSGPSAGGDEKLMLLKPTTYMNLSGQPVQSAMAVFNP